MSLSYRELLELFIDEDLEKFQEDEARIKMSGDIKSRKFHKGEFKLTEETTMTRYFWGDAERDSKEVIRVHNRTDELFMEGENQALEDAWMQKVEELLKDLFPSENP